MSNFHGEFLRFEELKKIFIDFYYHFKNFRNLKNFGDKNDQVTLDSVTEISVLS